MRGCGIQAVQAMNSKLNIYNIYITKKTHYISVKMYTRALFISLLSYILVVLNLMNL